MQAIRLGCIVREPSDRTVGHGSRTIQAWASSLAALLFVTASLVAGPCRAQDGPIHLQVVGGLAEVSQYNKFEVPFWVRDVPVLTHGRVVAEIHAFDRSGLPGQDMLQLMRLGVVPFGTALLAVVAGDEPEFNAVDLPLLNPDMASLRRTVGIFRPRLHQILRTKYGVELLGIYAYPAQVLYCTKRFETLRDLAGRRVRTSSVGQSELMSALGAIPVVTPFSNVVNAINTNVVDCAITGTMSGNQIGLAGVTSYIYPMAISWGLSFFGANGAAWDQIPPDIREPIQKGIGDLESAIWESANQETASGLACNIGSPECRGGKPFRMEPVPVKAEDTALREQILRSVVLPSWIQRCGSECIASWNGTLGRTTGILIPDE